MGNAPQQRSHDLTRRAAKTREERALLDFHCLPFALGSQHRPKQAPVEGESERGNLLFPAPPASRMMMMELGL